MMRLRTLAGCGLLFLAVPAWAGESLVGGEPVEYNHAYRCNGERVIVAHCRDEDDSSYCQVVYPDRPYQNGMQVAPVEMRGDVIARLNACNETASARTPSSGTGESEGQESGPPATSKAPGLGKASWQMLAFNDEQATYFTKAGIKRNGASADAWFTVVYPKPRDFSARLAGVQFSQQHFKADCTTGTFSFLEIAAFNDEFKLVGSAARNEEPSHPKPGSFAEAEVNVLCGKAQKLADKGPLNGDGDFLVMYYLARLGGVPKD